MGALVRLRAMSCGEKELRSPSFFRGLYPAPGTIHAHKEIQSVSG